MKPSLISWESRSHGNDQWPLVVRPMSVVRCPLPLEAAGRILEEIPPDRKRGRTSEPIRMSTTLRTKRKTSRFRWTAEQFQKAADDGWFGDRKVELLDGEVYLDREHRATHRRGVHWPSRAGRPGDLGRHAGHISRRRVGADRAGRSGGGPPGRQGDLLMIVVVPRSSGVESAHSAPTRVVR